jgi:coenzyme F420-0:L-glutamate ligase/coenzyme F420-1:gamma-L-glutamate ligase
MAHSGFLGLRNYIGKPDLFGNTMKVTQSSLAGGLAAAAVLAMGEGSEQTPICLITDAHFIKFQNRNPSANELKELYITIEDDIFDALISSAPWQKGHKQAKGLL